MEDSQGSSEHEQKMKSEGKFSEESFNKDGHPRSHHQTGQGSMFTERGGSGFPHYRLVILGLGLLNAVLLIAAVVIGIYCTKVSEGYLQIPHSAATPLVVELNYLRSNHSDVLKAKAEAQRALESELTSHQQLKLQLEQQTTINDGLQRLIETLHAERRTLLSNQTVFEESCGHCQPGWILLNSTCYFFSHPESDSKKSWPESRADCISRGADLLVIDNWEEQQLLTDNFPRTSSSGVWWSHGFWMGLTDIETEGTWVWVNNVTQLEPMYWIEGEPNNHGEQGENCAAFYARGDPQETWYDGKCNHHRYKWICETKPQ